VKVSALTHTSQLKRLIIREEQRVIGLRLENRYEDELFWSHQLFFKSWVPVEKKIVDDLEED
jgi:hypothetical protein